MPQILLEHKERTIKPVVPCRSGKKVNKFNVLQISTGFHKISDE
jgi:hypothetical protein